MAKRMTDTELHDKEWFMKLSCRLKCAVRYLFDKCDSAGVWEPNYTLAATYIGEGGFKEEEILEIDGGQQFEKLENGKLFVVGFCDFQYGKLSEDCKPHRPVIQKLIKYNLLKRVLEGYQKGFKTLEEKDKDIDKEKEQEKEKPARKKNQLLKLENGQVELAENYQRLQNDFKEQEPRSVFVAIRDFIQQNKPVFAEPYIDAWNIFAANNGLECVREITRDRREKLRTRTREPAFDFFKALQAIKQNPFYTGDNNRSWKIDFNFLIHSESNYIKLIEKFRDGPTKPQ